jgi:hypothetical protein
VVVRAVVVAETQRLALPLAELAQRVKAITEEMEINRRLQAAVVAAVLVELALISQAQTAELVAQHQVLIQLGLVLHHQA